MKSKKSKKSKSSPAVPPLETIRNKTAYKGARTFLGAPFILMGILFLFPATVSAISIFSGGEFNGLAIFPFIVSVLASLFCFSISALGNAIFDIADCAVRKDTADRHAESLQAYKDYQAAQNLG